MKYGVGMTALLCTVSHAVANENTWVVYQIHHACERSLPHLHNSRGPLLGQARDAWPPVHIQRGIGSVMDVLIGISIQSRLLLMWFCVTTLWPRFLPHKIELTTLAASSDCAASSTARPDISMTVAGFTSTSALADDVVLVRDSIVKAFWSQTINYDFIQCLGLSKRKRGYIMQQQCQTGIVTAEITGRLSLFLAIPAFGHNGRGWY